MRHISHFKKFAGKGLAIALAGLIGFSLQGVSSVHAAPPPSSTGTEANPASLSIWKNIQMATGTSTPAGTAKFKFTAMKVDGAAATATNMPAIPDRTIAFTAGDAGDHTADAAGVKTVSKKSANILSGIAFPHAGEYIYTVKEDHAGFTLTNNATKSEQMEYSTIEYQVQVIVANNASNTAVYVQSISVGVYDPGTHTVGTKVNNTDSGEGVGFGFTNKFNRTFKGSPTDPSAALQISKAVSGASGNTAAYFPFSLTVNDPASISASTPHGAYKAIIVEGSAAVDPSSNGITGAAADHSFSVTAGTAFSFKLKHGQSLAFIDLPVGASYTVSETNAQGHTANVKVISNGVAGSEAVATSSGPARHITEGADIAAFRNDKALATPTGIIINNLPYILLLAFAGAVITIVVAKKRREEA